MSLVRLVHPEDRARIRANVTLLTRNVSVEVDCRLRRSDGRWLPMRWSLSVDPEGSTIYGVGRDRTRGLLELEHARLHDRMVSSLADLLARDPQTVPSDSGMSARQSDDADSLSGLTPREFDVVLKVVSGLCNRKVADALNIKEGTVKQHLHHAFGKLGVSSRTQLAALARERGWV